MATYQGILRQFIKQGLNEDQEVTEQEIKRALDKISTQNAGVYQFDSNVSNEIWEETLEKNNHDSVRLKDYIVTLVEAESILRTNVNNIESDIRLETNESKRKELLSDLFSYSQDHRAITGAFNLQQLRQSKQIRESKHTGKSFSHSVIFSTEIDQREESTDLKFAFFFTFALLCLQIVLMYHKHHFFTLLSVCFVFAAFILDYFDKNYVKFILGILGVGILLDFVWLIVMAEEYWDPKMETQHSTLHTGFLKFIVFMVCVQILLKFLVGGLLLKYREIGDQIRKKATIFGLSFSLKGQPNPNNLFRGVLTNQRS